MDSSIDTQILQGLQQLLQMVQDPHAQQLLQQIIQLQQTEIQQEQGQGQGQQQPAQGPQTPQSPSFLGQLTGR